jgi:hypothetical protein
MENVVEGIPASLYENLSKNLIEIVLGTQDKNAVPADIAKKVIYLWRQDQLATPTGVSTLMEAAVMVDANATYSTLDKLGLPEITIALKNLQ